MPDAAWKAFERRIAAFFGGQRRGADFRGANGGKSDVIARGFSIECKLLGRPSYADLLEAARQAEASASAIELPIAVVKRKRAQDSDALVVLRLETFLDWFGPERRIAPEPEELAPSSAEDGVDPPRTFRAGLAAGGADAAGGAQRDERPRHRLAR